ncbi:MAG: GNAT family N-acetyltransferase [Planctomycetaceae bacterium]
MTIIPEQITIRIAEATDAESIAQLFYETIHQVNRQHYSEEQLQAWAPAIQPAEYWIARQNRLTTFVANHAGTLAGFAELDLQSEPARIDCFYGHKDYQRRGIGTRLMTTLKQFSLNSDIDELRAEVSLTALPFFQRHHFEIIREQQVYRNGIQLTNFLMKCSLR